MRSYVTSLPAASRSASIRSRAAPSSCKSCFTAGSTWCGFIWSHCGNRALGSNGLLLVLTLSLLGFALVVLAPASLLLLLPSACTQTRVPAQHNSTFETYYYVRGLVWLICSAAASLTQQDSKQLQHGFLSSFATTTQKRCARNRVAKVRVENLQQRCSQQACVAMRPCMDGVPGHTEV